MISSPRTLNLPDTLFESQETEEEGAGGFSAEEEPSAEFSMLVGKTREKIDRRKTKPKTIAAAVFNRALVETDEMLRSGDWEGATAKHLVALYDRMHERVYGFEPAELGPTERFFAAKQAGGMLRREFSDVLPDMVEYMLWAWERERGTEKWRKENGREGRRLGVRLIFGKYLLDDYRLFLARRGQRP